MFNVGFMWHLTEKTETFVWCVENSLKRVRRQMEEAGKQVFCMELVPRTSPLIAVGESNSEQSSAALLTGFWVSNIYSQHKPLIALACEGIKLLPLGPGLTQTLIPKEISRKMSQERQRLCMCHVNLVLYQYSTVYLRRPYSFNSHEELHRH